MDLNQKFIAALGMTMGEAYDAHEIIMAGTIAVMNRTPADIAEMKRIFKLGERLRQDLARSEVNATPVERPTTELSQLDHPGAEVPSSEFRVQGRSDIPVATGRAA